MRRVFHYSIAFLAFALVVYFVGGTIYVWWHVPEAYAAWDTGTLLVRYMEKHGGDWPDGWPALEQLHHDEPHLRLRWNAHQPDYFDQMRSMVSVDWAFDPISRRPEGPVTSVDGSALVCLWSDPNNMIDFCLDRMESATVGPPEN